MMKIPCKNIQATRIHILKTEKQGTKRYCQICQISKTNANPSDNLKEISDKTRKSYKSKGNINGKMFRMRTYLVIVLVILISGYLQYGRDVAVCSSNPRVNSNGYLEDIAITANKLYIFDQEKFAKCILQRCVENSFKEVRFSYDLSGYPNEVHISVYMNQLTWKLKKKAFEIQYIPDGSYYYNIVEHPEMFRIDIKNVIY